jgi:hypothetical protein
MLLYGKVLLVEMKSIADRCLSLDTIDTLAATFFSVTFRAWIGLPLASRWLNNCLLSEVNPCKWTKVNLNR